MKRRTQERNEKRKKKEGYRFILIFFFLYKIDDLPSFSLSFKYCRCAKSS